LLITNHIKVTQVLANFGIPHTFHQASSEHVKELLAL